MFGRTQGMGVAAVIIGVSVLLSRLMGLVRDKVVSVLFGAGAQTDVYFAAFVVPDFINYLLAGAYFSITLIPLLAEYAEQGEAQVREFFSAVFCWIAAASAILVGAAYVLAPELARLTAPGLSPQDLDVLARFLRIILPAQVFFLLGACLMAVLYQRRRFLVPALAPLIYNAGIILGGIVLRERGMEGFCWGVAAGAMLGNFLLPLVAALGCGLRIQVRFRHPGLKRFFLLALPLMIGQSIVVLDEQLIRFFGSLAGTGAISHLNYARRIMMVPVGVVAQAAGVASYPFLVRLLAEGRESEFARTLATALRNTVVLTIPLSVWMMTVAVPTIRLIFRQGRFSETDAASTGILLAIMLAGVAFWGVQQLLGRAFYARQDTVTPAILGTLLTVACLPIYYLGGRFWQAGGVAAASAVSIGLYALALGLWWIRKFGRDVFAGIGPTLLKVCGLSAVSGLPSWLAVTGMSGLWPGSPYLSSTASIAVSGAVFALIFLSLANRFAPDLSHPLLSRGGRAGRLLMRL